MSLGFFFEASSLSHSLSNFSDRLSAESEEEIWYMSDNSRRCLYPFLKIGLVQPPCYTFPSVGQQNLLTNTLKGIQTIFEAKVAC